MDFPAVQAVLNDLPDTFKRIGTPYTQFIDALTSALSLYTIASDSLVAQQNFNNAVYGWLDVWGLLCGVPRRPNEADSVYRARIKNTILSWHATPLAMITWLQVIEGLTATISEGFPAVGYTITLPPTLTAAQILAVLINFAYVRPAGVPFALGSSIGGLFQDTINYQGAERVTGSYLGQPTSLGSIGIPASTNNFVAQLPDLLFTDPNINPNLPA